VTDGECVSGSEMVSEMVMDPDTNCDGVADGSNESETEMVSVSRSERVRDGDAALSLNVRVRVCSLEGDTERDLVRVRGFEWVRVHDGVSEPVSIPGSVFDSVGGGEMVVVRVKVGGGVFVRLGVVVTSVDLEWVGGGVIVRDKVCVSTSERVFDDVGSSLRDQDREKVSDLLGVGKDFVRLNSLVFDFVGVRFEKVPVTVPETVTEKLRLFSLESDNVADNERDMVTSVDSEGDIVDVTSLVSVTVTVADTFAEKDSVGVMRERVMVCSLERVVVMLIDRDRDGVYDSGGHTSGYRGNVHSTAACSVVQGVAV